MGEGATATRLALRRRSRRKSQRIVRRKNEPRIDPVEFWGDRSSLPEPITSIDEVPDVKAVVQSLGRVPITGHETAADHWFSLVYEGRRVGWGARAAGGCLHGADGEEETRWRANVALRLRTVTQAAFNRPVRPTGARVAAVWHGGIIVMFGTQLRPGSVGGGCAARLFGARQLLPPGSRTCRPTLTTPSPCSGCRTPASRSVLRRAASTLARGNPGRGCGVHSPDARRPAGGAEPFVDVGPEDYFADAVAWMAENGVTQGTSPTHYSPYRNVTRGEVATFIHQQPRACRWR